MNDSVSESPLTEQPAVVPSSSNQPANMELRLRAIERKLDRILRTVISTTQKTTDESGVVITASEAMRAADMPELQIASLFNDLRTESKDGDISESDIYDELIDRVSRGIQTDLSFKPGDRPLFMGPAGSGKTSLIGKIASQLIMNEKITVTLATLDTTKVAAQDEIGSYSDLLGVSVTDPQDILDKKDSKKKVVLIDTSSLPAGDNNAAGIVKEFDSVKPTHRILVFSALTGSADVESIAHSVVPLKPTHLALTMTDLVNGWGTALAAVEATGAKLALVTDGPSGIGKAMAPNESTIAAGILDLERKNA